MNDLIKKTERAWIEIDLNNLEHNVRIIKQVIPENCKLMAVVKARAYGHGASLVSRHLNKIGIEAFAVATVDEGIELRKKGVYGEILILGYTNVCRASEIREYGLMQTIIDLNYALELNRRNIPIKVHLKIDTGMHRLGIDGRDIESIQRVFDLKNIEVCGIYTHLCQSESLELDDEAYTQKQIDCFYNVIEVLKVRKLNVPGIHIQSSYGILNYSGIACDYVRAGIILYGIYSSTKDKTRMKLDLHPVLSLKARVVLIRTVYKGESVGYGRAFVADKERKIAILPIGYGDGYPRNLSCGHARVCINGRYAPIVGKICMDQLAIDITDIKGVSVGDVATLIGEDRELSAPFISEQSDSISNELLCRLGERLQVVAR